MWLQRGDDGELQFFEKTIPGYLTLAKIPESLLKRIKRLDVRPTVCTICCYQTSLALCESSNISTLKVSCSGY